MFGRKRKSLSERLQDRRIRAERWSGNYQRLLPGCPLISLVLPVYNHAKLLQSSVRSVLAEHEIPLELIVVDDGSIDHPEKSIRKELSDPRVRLIRQENKGLSAALNRGFKEATGAFFTWTSADNLYESGALQALSRALLERASLSLTYGNVRLIDGSGNDLRTSNYREADKSTADTSVLHLPSRGELLFEADDNFINACLLYRKTFARAAGGYNSEFNGLEDYDYWLRITAFSPARHIPEIDAFYRYRLHPESLTGRLDAKELAQNTRIRRLFLKRLRDEIKSELEKFSSAEIASQLDLPQPIENQIALLRARDSCFRAIADRNSKKIFGLVPSEDELPPKDISIPRGVKLAIFLLSPQFIQEWKQFADVNGITLVADFPGNFAELSEKEYRTRSLMFFLSSIEATISFSQDPLRIRDLAVIAAESGRELCLVWNKASLALPFTSSTFENFLPAPHVFFYSSLDEIVREKPVSIPLSALDDWLQSQSTKGQKALLGTTLILERLSEKTRLPSWGNR